jgi:hypothetical protein
MPLPADPDPGPEDDEVIWRDRIDPLTPESLRPHEPRTVAAGFAEFRERLVPKYTESETAVATLQVIERCLRQAFDVAFVAPYGSRGHGTNVRGFSAIDSFAVIPTSDLYEDSGKSLQHFHKALASRLPDAFVTGGRPVVAVPFGARPSERHHVVPAFHRGARGDHDLFAVPAPRSRWITISPGAHSNWINELDRTLNNNLKSFIRVVKAWSYYNEDVVWRYYLELCAADYLKNDSEVAYSHDLCRFFDYLADRELAPFESTEGCDEPVYGTSIADRESALARIRATAAMAKKARECEQKGNVPDAFYWWRKIFDWRFAAF